MKEDVESIYKKAGFSGDLKIGNSPAILVIDFQYGFTDPSISPLAGNFERELKNTRKILNAAREKKIPIYFFVVGYNDDSESGVWGEKVPTLKTLKLGTRLTEIDKTLNPQADEVINIKKFASAFAGTPTASILKEKKIDSLIITGTTTCGCVRATAVDAIQSGFKPFVVEDAVCDRIQQAHDNSIIDMRAKYAEIWSTEDAVNYINNLK